MAKQNLVAAAFKLANIWKALVNAVRDLAIHVGISPEDADAAINALEAVESAPLLARLAALILGKEPAAQVTWPCQVYAPELIPQGMSVVEDVVPTDFKVEDLEFVGVLEGKEEPVSGRVMRGRALTLGANLGLADGKRILTEQAKILAD